LRELLEHRFKSLSQLARDVGTAAAVLGREADVDLVTDVASLAADVGQSVIDELLHHYILEEPTPGSLRFSHDKLREVAYRRASPMQLTLLHGRAATALAHRLDRAPDPKRYWATLGHHFSAAKNPPRAAWYLQLAANHARSTFANGEAIRLYKEAISHASQVIASLPTHDRPAWRDEVLAEQESLADVLTLVGRRDEARAAYERAFRQTPKDRKVTLARLRRKVGKTWEMQHEHKHALRLYRWARRALPKRPKSDNEAAVAEWIQVQIEQLWVYYWLNNVKDMDATIARLRPSIDRFAAPLQRANFFQIQALFTFRRDRYLVSEETIRHARSALESGIEGGDVTLTGLPAQFTYGFALLFQRSYEQADVELNVVLASAIRAGDTGLQARCLTYLALSARMRGLTSETSELSKRAAGASNAVGMMEYIGAAHANDAWLSLKRGDLIAAVESGQLAIQAWTQRMFPFQWMALIPVLEAELANLRTGPALLCASQLLEPTQQYLPGAAADGMSRAIRCSSEGDLVGARAALVSGLEYLDGTGYR
jgi:tetratricopeptide (TPR) repeat protein